MFPSCDAYNNTESLPRAEPLSLPDLPPAIRDGMGSTSPPAQPPDTAASPPAHGPHSPEGDAGGGVRRSGRVPKRRAVYGDEQDEDELAHAPPPPRNPSQAKKKVRVLPRRNPTREAAAAAPRYGSPVPDADEILEKALAPLLPKDLEEWRGWTDVESEPVRNPRALVMHAVEVGC